MSARTSCKCLKEFKMDKNERREFLKNSLKFGAVAVAVGAKGVLADDAPQDEVAVGKSKKKEELYKQSESWKDYYKVAY